RLPRRISIGEAGAESNSPNARLAVVDVVQFRDLGAAEGIEVQQFGEFAGQPSSRFACRLIPGTIGSLVRTSNHGRVNAPCRRPAKFHFPERRRFRHEPQRLRVKWTGMTPKRFTQSPCR